MSSQAQINANRLNSKKSTGPTSPEGKASSSMNALKSGIHASYIIPGENPAELEALTAAFLLHHQPADPNQLALVDTLIAAEWTQRRLRRIEAELWNSGHEYLDPTHAKLSTTLPNPIQFPTLGDSSPDALDPFIRIQRRIDATNRMYLRTRRGRACPARTGRRPVTPAPEPPSPKQSQPHLQPTNFVLPSTPSSAEWPPVSHENHESRPEAAYLKTDRPVADS